MATPTPTKPVLPTKPTAPFVGPPAPPTAPVAPAAEPKKKSEPRKEWTYYFDTADAAKVEAEKRDGGPRRPFEMKLGDKIIFVVAHNPEHAAKLAWEKLSGETTEIGKEKAAKKALGVEGILAALAALPEAEQAAIKEAMAKLGTK